MNKSEKSYNILKLFEFFKINLSRIHLLGSRGVSQDHPDSRAILYEEVQYSRKNIIDFVATLDGYGLAMKVVQKMLKFNLE